MRRTLFAALLGAWEPLSPAAFGRTLKTARRRRWAFDDWLMWADHFTPHVLIGWVVCMVLALSATAAFASPPIPTTGQTFSEDFSTLDRVTASNPKGRWSTTLAPGNLSLGARQLQSNGEAEVYLEPEFPGMDCGVDPVSGTPWNIYGRAGPPVYIAPMPGTVTATNPLGTPYPCYTHLHAGPGLGFNPFKLVPTGLAITADKLPRDPLTWNGLYYSGALTTLPSFAQLYGYFEVIAQSPAGDGLWPAFWLLPKDRTWPPEIDVTEQGGRDVHTVWQSSHFWINATTKGWHSAGTVQAADLSKGFHAYGAAWTPTEIVWYVDNVETRREPNPGINKPMYILINLAVCGSWQAIGCTDATTVFPATFYVASVKAWTLPAGPVPAATLPVGPLPPPVLPPPPPPPAKRTMDVVGKMGSATFVGTLTEQ